MDCHRCEHIRYDGCPYGRCSVPGRQDVRFERRKPGDGRSRPYSRLICTDFRMKKRCSNCRYWKRGRYFSDGKTPAQKGKCSLEIRTEGSICKMWSAGPTSWKRRTDADPVQSDA